MNKYKYTVEPNTPEEQQHLTHILPLSRSAIECAAIGNFSDTDDGLGWLPVVTVQLYFDVLHYRLKNQRPADLPVSDAVLIAKSILREIDK